MWRVFIDGEEFLASSVKLLGEFSDKKSFENGVEKLNIFCLGDVSWNKTEAIITSNKDLPGVQVRNKIPDKVRE